MNLHDILLYFFLYGFLGWLTEVIYAAAKQKKYVNRGFLNGPICPIYGIGVTVVVVLTTPFVNSVLLLYIVSALLVTILELVTGVLLEIMFNHRWWDYSDERLNLGGYVCVKFSCIWGAARVIIVKYIHPLIVKLVSFIPIKTGSVILIALVFALTADIFVTVSAILSLNEKLKDIKGKIEKVHKLPEKMADSINKNMIGEIKKKSVIRRLFNAFPNIRSNKYGDEMSMLKSALKDMLDIREKKND